MGTRLLYRLPLYIKLYLGGGGTRVDKWLSSMEGPLGNSGQRVRVDWDFETTRLATTGNHYRMQPWRYDWCLLMKSTGSCIMTKSSHTLFFAPLYMDCPTIWKMSKRYPHSPALCNSKFINSRKLATQLHKINFAYARNTVL